jgi:hypothetical protein
VWPRAHLHGRPRLYKSCRPLMHRPFRLETLASSSAAPPSNPSVVATVSRPSAALPSPRRSPGASLQGKERDGVACCRPGAPHRRNSVAGVAPPRSAAPCAVSAAPASTLLSSRARAGEWSTPASNCHLRVFLADRSSFLRFSPGSLVFVAV